MLFSPKFRCMLNTPTNLIQLSRRQVTQSVTQVVKFHHLPEADLRNSGQVWAPGPHHLHCLPPAVPVCWPFPTGTGDHISSHPHTALHTDVPKPGLLRTGPQRLHGHGKATAEPSTLLSVRARSWRWLRSPLSPSTSVRSSDCHLPELAQVR